MFTLAREVCGQPWTCMLPCLEDAHHHRADWLYSKPLMQLKPSSPSQMCSYQGAVMKWYASFFP